MEASLQQRRAGCNVCAAGVDASAQIADAATVEASEDIVVTAEKRGQRSPRIRPGRMMSSLAN
jgi:hypothetical protein